MVGHHPAAPLSADAFTLRGPDGTATVNLIDIDRRRTTTLGHAQLRFVGGQLALPLPEDMLLLSVVPRHGQSHPPSLALLSGLGLRRGAIASTVAHDSHNLLVAGTSPQEMLAACRAVADTGGGAALVVDGSVVASVKLSVAGVMSPDSVASVAAEVRTFNERGRALGLWAGSPVLAISSLALTVAPHVRISDLGVVDVVSQQFVPMFG